MILKKSHCCKAIEYAHNGILRSMCSELKELCDVCEEHKIQFISDEIYHGISFGKVNF